MQRRPKYLVDFWKLFKHLLIPLSLVSIQIGEFQQLQTVRDEEERFQLYLNKSFNKTASLMAYSCKANAILSFDYLNTSNYEKTLSPEEAYQYGRNLGIAFQLVDDLLGKKWIIEIQAILKFFINVKLGLLIIFQFRHRFQSIFKSAGQTSGSRFEIGASNCSCSIRLNEVSRIRADDRKKIFPSWRCWSSIQCSFRQRWIRKNQRSSNTTL